MENIFNNAIENYIGKENLILIQDVKIGIAGAGGLGSNCAMNLVRSGFSCFKIIDFDKVEPSNLNRQFYFIDQIGKPKVIALKENLIRINPGLKLEMIEGKVTKDNVSSLFNDCDVIVEAFDNPVYKQMLVETYYKSGKLLIAASGLAGWGNSDEIKVNQINDSIYIIGDSKSEAEDSMPPCSPRVNITAAKQADTILSRVLRKEGQNGENV